MEMLLFTVVAVVLYIVADRALDALERRSGRRFEHRTLIFFAILLGLAMTAFALIRSLAPGA
jgi:hypothetical protein